MSKSPILITDVTIKKLHKFRVENHFLIDGEKYFYSPIRDCLIRVDYIKKHNELISNGRGFEAFVEYLQNNLLS